MPSKPYAPPAALVEAVARRGDPDWWAFWDANQEAGAPHNLQDRDEVLENVRRVLVASGIGDLVVLIERLASATDGIEEEKITSDQVDILSAAALSVGREARTLLATLIPTGREG